MRREARPDMRCALLATCCVLATPAALAHETAERLPAEPGLRWGVAVAVARVQASSPLPSQALQGYLVQGDPGVDRRDHALEHAVVDLAWRFQPDWSAYVALGQHGTDAPHTEAAWLQWQGVARDGATWALRAGRTPPQIGPVMGDAGHLDPYTLMPLARQVALNGNWMEDGLQLSVQHEAAMATLYGDLGLWRSNRFPGAPGSAVAPSAHLGAARGPWRLDAFGLIQHPDGRGAYARSAGGGHSHGGPSCASPSPGVLCFGGRTTVWGTSLRWQSPQWPLTLDGAYWQRNDDGTLRSINGRADHQAEYQGGWLQAHWQPHADWGLGWRHERIRAQLSLVGAGATLLAQEAGFFGTTPLQRDTLQLGWQATRQIRLSIEAGRETQGQQHVNFSVLRAVIRLDPGDDPH